VKKDLSLHGAHPGPRRAAIAETPGDRKAEGVVTFRLLSRGERQAPDPRQKPREAVSSVNLSQVFQVRDVRVFERLFFQKRQELGQGGAQPVRRLVFFPFDPDAAAESFLQPQDDFVGIVRRDRCPDDARDLRVVEGVEIGPRRLEPRDPLGNRRQPRVCG
jgi:hypothetical protein